MSLASTSQDGQPSAKRKPSITACGRSCRLVRRKGHYFTIDMDDIEPSLQQHAPTNSGAELAPQACSSCRKQKRKCDKQLPSCGLCVRIGRLCDYVDDSRGPAPSSEEFSSLRQEVAELKNLLARGVAPTAQASNGHSNSNGSNSSSSNAAYTGISNGSYSNDGSPPSIFVRMLIIRVLAVGHTRFSRALRQWHAAISRIISVMLHCSTPESVFGSHVLDTR